MTAQTGLAILAGVAMLWTYLACAQPPWGFPPATTPDAQRNALNKLRTSVGWLDSAMRTAPSYGQQGVNQVWQQFQLVRGAYTEFKSTLTPRQLDYGANDLADLEAGLDILQEVFSNYQADVAGGQPESYALRNLCQVLRQAMRVWLQELIKDSNRLHVGSHMG